MMPAEQAATPAAATTTTATPSLLDQVITATRPQSTREAERTKDFFKQFLDQVIQPGMVVSKDVETNIKYWVSEVDKKVSAQLNEVMHHPDFQKLEGTWRGLKYLIDQSETGENLKIKVLNVAKTTLAKDLERAIEFDQSMLFEHVYENEYGQLGGKPYGMLVGDYDFDGK